MKQDTWPDRLTPDLRLILGLMCFQLGGMAHGYRQIGEYVADDPEPLKKRAEDEQAFMLHKLLGLWFEYGASWGEAADLELKRMQSALAALRPTSPS